MPPIPAPPTGTVSITARLRDSETAPDRRPQPFIESGFHRCTTSTPARSPSRPDPAGRLLPAADGRPAGRSQGSAAPPTRCRAVPVLRHPMDRLRYRRPAGSGLLPLRRDPDATPRSRRTDPGRIPGRRGFRSAGHRAGEDRRPLRTPALKVTATASAAPVPTATAGPPGEGHATPGGRPRLRGLADLNSWRYCGRATQSDAECAGERCLHDAGVRAGMPGRVAPPGPRRTSRRAADQARAHHHQSTGQPGRRYWRHRRAGPPPNRIGRTAATGCRSSRRGC